MTDPPRLRTIETSQFDWLLDGFSRHLLLAEAVTIGSHDPLSCSECMRWCSELAAVERHHTASVVRGLGIDDADLLEIELRRFDLEE